MHIITTDCTLHTLVILTTGTPKSQDHTIMFTAASMDAIIHHLGGALPSCRSVRIIPSTEPVTATHAEKIATFPDFRHITQHINLCPSA